MRTVFAALRRRARECFGRSAHVLAASKRLGPPGERLTPSRPPRHTARGLGRENAMGR
jgi:hypothetical protein